MDLKTKTTISEAGGGSRYKSGEVDVFLPQYDTDVNLILPHGEKIICQYRIEGPSLDVCLPDNLPVTNWQGADMQPAPQYQPKKGIKAGKKMEHIRSAAQVCVGLDPAWLESTEPPPERPEKKTVLKQMPLMDMTPEQFQRFKEAEEKKHHAEYQCYQMLERIMRALPIEEWTKLAVKRGDLDESVYTEFFGDPEENDLQGGHNIESLLNHWRTVTDEMCRVVAESAHRKK